MLTGIIISHFTSVRKCKNMLWLQNKLSPHFCMELIVQCVLYLCSSCYSSMVNALWSVFIDVHIIWLLFCLCVGASMVYSCRVSRSRHVNAVSGWIFLNFQIADSAWHMSNLGSIAAGVSQLIHPFQELLVAWSPRVLFVGFVFILVQIFHQRDWGPSPWLAENQLRFPA